MLPGQPLPRRVSFVGVFPLRTQQEVEASAEPPLFRDCATRGAWTGGSDRGRYRDFDSGLADELRSAGPQFVVALDPHELHTAVKADEQLVEVCGTFGGEPVRLRHVDGRLGLTTVGYGALRLDFDVEAGGPGGPELVDLSLAVAVQDRLDALVARFVCDLPVPGAGAALFALPCLWTHTAYRLDAAPALDRLAPTADEERPVVRLADGAYVAPGLGSTVVVAGEDEFATYGGVLALVTCYYAALADVDRRTFRELTRWRSGATPAGSAGDLYEEVSLFRAVLSTLDLHLAASTALEVRLWGAVSTTWRMSALMEAMTSKLELLRRFEERAAEQQSLARERELAVGALVFAVLSMVGTVLALIEFDQGPPLQAPDPLRLGTSIALAVTTVLGLALWLSRRRRRAR